MGGCNDYSPMPSGQPIPNSDVEHILSLFTDLRKRGMAIMDCYTRIGQLMDRDPKVIGTVVNRFRPTTDTAKMYFRARALKMAQRIVRKGSPSELMDILSRPSIGVLDAAKKADEAGGGNFFISVNADTCGAVKVGVASMKEAPQLESGEAYDPFSETIDVGQENYHVENGNAVDAGRVEGADEGLSVIERVRSQLARVRHAKTEGGTAGK